MRDAKLPGTCPCEHTRAPRCLSLSAGVRPWPLTFDVLLFFFFWLPLQNVSCIEHAFCNEKTECACVLGFHLESDECVKGECPRMVFVSVGPALRTASSDRSTISDAASSFVFGFVQILLAKTPTVLRTPTVTRPTATAAAAMGLIRSSRRTFAPRKVLLGPKRLKRQRVRTRRRRMSIC